MRGIGREIQGKDAINGAWAVQRFIEGPCPKTASSLRGQCDNQPDLSKFRGFLGLLYSRTTRFRWGIEPSSDLAALAPRVRLN
jgi:hypothetical protein